MSDNKNYVGWQDRIKVDLNDPNEVEYFHRIHPIFSHDEIKKAIKENGPLRENIHGHLIGLKKSKASILGLFATKGAASGLIKLMANRNSYKQEDQSEHKKS